MKNQNSKNTDNPNQGVNHSTNFASNTHSNGQNFHQKDIQDINLSQNLNKNTLYNGHNNLVKNMDPQEVIRQVSSKHEDITKNQLQLSEQQSAQVQKMKNGHHENQVDYSQNNCAPIQTFEKQSFKDKLTHQDGTVFNLNPTIELTQAFMMTSNLKEVACLLNGSTAASILDPLSAAQNNLKKEQMVDAGRGYFKKTDLISDLLHKFQSKDMAQVNRLLLNLGTQDKASNWLIEQRNLQRALAKEGRDIRDLIQKEFVDNQEYMRAKEQIVISKYKSQKHLNEKDEDLSQTQADNLETSIQKEEAKQKIIYEGQCKVKANKFNQTIERSKSSFSSVSSETQEDSGHQQNILALKGEDHFNFSKNEFLTENDRKLIKIIQQIRKYGKYYLSEKQMNFEEEQKNQNDQNQFENQNQKNIYDRSGYLNFNKHSLATICKELRQNNQFKKDWDRKRELKKKYKESSEQLEKQNNQNANVDIIKNKLEIQKQIQELEESLNLQKRIKTTQEDQNISIQKIDEAQQNNQSTQIQNIFLDYCNLKNNNIEKQIDINPNLNLSEKIYGKIRKIPANSSLLQNYGDKFFDLNDEEDILPEQQQVLLQLRKQENNERFVKVIGLEPEKLFQKIPKYKVQVDKLPNFSSCFDQVDSQVLGCLNKNTLSGQSILNPISSNNIHFQRIDGRQVISLQFNPYFINSNEDKKKIYEDQMKEILEQREKVKNAPKETKSKMEQQNFKRAWQNIVKKDIPKAFRMYQKFKADQENNNKKLSQNCLKEVRKKAIKTQRLAKESVMRARKLSREMLNFWRKRDRELADGKRKREKLDKELKKKQQEEEETLLQKKRLEYLMQQSEIYAHFMATKLGVSDELNKQKEENSNVTANNRKLEIDKKAARKQIVGIINDNRKRLDDFDDHDRDEVREEDLEDDFEEQNNFNSQKPIKIVVEPPKMFKGDLKHYQLKGLQWLDNLYDQGINGILADEMGLGKTIQAISLLAHLAEKKNVWGPFLIVVPVTTLHNWQNELAKFCPDLKVLPYFGSAEERKKLAKFLDPKNLYNPAMRIHVLITSYNLIVGGGKDQMRLQRVKWHYMILDEAQAIKNNASRRWKTLLNFQTRNRLLLSGTPIQNSMAELWALLHFIMPKLFDNHEQFQEWFSKDIEQHSMDQGELNKHQLKRLHLILQPFMLRRLKKDVEQEIAPKIEEIIQCEMSHRQKVLYDRIKRKISAQDLFQLASSKAKVENLMNLVMQFRKVCNHPDLFEKRMGKIPFVFAQLNLGIQQNMLLPAKPEIYSQNENPIKFKIPKMVYDELFLISDNNMQLYQKQKKNLDISFSTVSAKTHFDLFNIFNESNIFNNIYSSEESESKLQFKYFTKTFSIVALLVRSNSWSFSDIAYNAVIQSQNGQAYIGNLISSVAIMHNYVQKQKLNDYLNIHNSESNLIELPFGSFGFKNSNLSKFRTRAQKQCVDVIVKNFVSKNDWSNIYREYQVENLDLKISGNWSLKKALIPGDPMEFLNFSFKIKKMLNIYYEKCISEPQKLVCASTSFQRFFNSVKYNPMAKKILIGKDFKPAKNQFIGKIGRERSSFLTEDHSKLQSHHIGKAFECGPPVGYDLLEKGILEYTYKIKGSCTLQLPDYSRMVTDCSKMTVLAELLARLHKEGHRCLIFCQMTRMMDILEDFLIWQKYSYFRMDGSTLLQDRRFMVEEYQTNPNIFAFILSTRAGGLGINLIAADTVIFYDNDWNPTMDSQATDRAHRIGQKKTVHVYRLVTKNTVEERILRRARQKESVQSTVYGANLKADQFSTRDVVDMIIDDIEDPIGTLANQSNQVKGFIKGSAGQKKGNGRKKKAKQVDTSGVYESVKRGAFHEKYEKEFDELLKGMEDQVGQQLNKQEDENAEMEEDDKNSENSIEQIDLKLDKKNLLLKMLDQQNGGAKQIFNFEEDDNAGFSSNQIKEQNHGNNQKIKNGGVKSSKNKNLKEDLNSQEEEEDEDEEMRDDIEEGEY